MRKTLNVVLALVLMIGACVPVFATNSTPFLDVDEDDLYAEAVTELFEDGIIVGDDEGNYNPGNDVTRQEMATFICRLLDEEENAKAITKSSFTDVITGMWSVGYVARAAELGIVGGYGDGTFGPTDPVTVVQAAKMLVCAWGYNDQAVEAGGWPAGYLEVANNLGILEDIESGVDDNANRAEIAMMIYATRMRPTAGSQDGGVGDDEYIEDE